MRRQALALVFVLGLTLLPNGVAAQSAAPSPTPGLEEPAVPPDIILVMVDDLGYLPRDQVLERLPSVRELWLEGGLRFTEMHDQSPLCGPSRVSMLTGKDTLHHGITKNFMHGLDDSETIAVALDDAGYQTRMVGRYLNRYDGSVVPPGWDHAFMQRDSDRTTFWDDGASVRFKGKDRDDVIRQEALRSIRQAPADEPLFAWVSLGVPHVCEDEQGGQCYEPEVIERDQGSRACRDVKPSHPPSYTTHTNRREVRAMPPWPKGWRLGRICDSLQVLDRTVRGLVSAQAKRDRDAVFVLMSDNGMSWGQNGFSLKHTPPATRTPFYVAGPGVAPGETSALTSNADIAPTLAELAGTSLPWADGQSFVPLLRSEAGAGGTHCRAERHLELMPASSGYEGWEALRTPERRFIRWEDGHRELYDLEADPWQRRNLVKRQPNVADAMELRLDELLTASAAEGAADRAVAAEASALPASSPTPTSSSTPTTSG